MMSLSTPPDREVEALRDVNAAFRTGMHEEDDDDSADTGITVFDTVGRADERERGGGTEQNASGGGSGAACLEPRARHAVVSRLLLPASISYSFCFFTLAVDGDQVAFGSFEDGQPASLMTCRTFRIAR